MSLAFTLTVSTSLFTRDTSPFLQASNSSLKAPLVPQPLPPGLALPESGVEPALLPPPVVDELVLLELELLLLLVLRSGAGISAVISGSLMLSGSPTTAEQAVSVGDSRGVRGLESGLGGEDKFCCWCCCCCWEVRRDVAIFEIGRAHV